MALYTAGTNLTKLTNDYKAIWTKPITATYDISAITGLCYGKDSIYISAVKVSGVTTYAIITIDAETGNEITRFIPVAADVAGIATDINYLYVLYSFGRIYKYTMAGVEVARSTGLVYSPTLKTTIAVINNKMYFVNRRPAYEIVEVPMNTLAIQARSDIPDVTGVHVYALTNDRTHLYYISDGLISWIGKVPINLVGYTQNQLSQAAQTLVMNNDRMVTRWSFNYEIMEYDKDLTLVNAAVAISNDLYILAINDGVTTPTRKTQIAGFGAFKRKRPVYQQPNDII